MDPERVFLNFSYGSNLCVGWLRSRVPSARPVAVASLTRHALRFHKKSSRDGSAKADAFSTGDPADTVWGVVYVIRCDEKQKLDRAEGLGFGYLEIEVEVVGVGGQVYSARMYGATERDADLVPYDWYRRLVVDGARAHGLPEDYVRCIEAVETTADADEERRQKGFGAICSQTVERSGAEEAPSEGGAE